jgi:hypothetical protein
LKIRNVRLLTRVARALANPAPTPCPVEAEPPPLALLGRGLDAVICAARYPEPIWIDRLLNPRGVKNALVPPTAERRLARYRDARLLYASESLQDATARELRGHAVKHVARTARAAVRSSNVVAFPAFRARSA